MQIFAEEGTVNIQGWVGRVVVRGGICSCSDERVATTPTRTDPVRCLCGAAGAGHQQTDGQAAAATEQQCLDFEGRREEPVHERRAGGQPKDEDGEGEGGGQSGHSCGHWLQLREEERPQFGLVRVVKTRESHHGRLTGELR